MASMRACSRAEAGQWGRVWRWRTTPRRRLAGGFFLRMPRLSLTGLWVDLVESDEGTDRSGGNCTALAPGECRVGPGSPLCRVSPQMWLGWPRAARKVSSLAVMNGSWQTAGRSTVRCSGKAALPPAMAIAPSGVGLNGAEIIAGPGSAAKRLSVRNMSWWVWGSCCKARKLAQLPKAAYGLGGRGGAYSPSGG